MVVAFFGDGAAAGSALDEAHLHKVWLVDLFDGRLFFREGSGDGLQSHRTTFKFLGDDGKDVAVGLVQSHLVYLEERERFFYRLQIQSLLIHFREITCAFQ